MLYLGAQSHSGNPVNSKNSATSANVARSVKRPHIFSHVPPFGSIMARADAEGNKRPDQAVQRTVGAPRLGKGRPKQVCSLPRAGGNPAQGTIARHAVTCGHPVWFFSEKFGMSRHYLVLA